MARKSRWGRGGGGRVTWLVNNELDCGSAVRKWVELTADGVDWATDRMCGNGFSQVRINNSHFQPSVRPPVRPSVRPPSVHRMCSSPYFSMHFNLWFWFPPRQQYRADAHAQCTSAFCMAVHYSGRVKFSTVLLRALKIDNPGIIPPEQEPPESTTTEPWP